MLLTVLSMMLTVLLMLLLPLHNLQRMQMLPSQIIKSLHLPKRVQAALDLSIVFGFRSSSRNKSLRQYLGSELIQRLGALRYQPASGEGDGQGKKDVCLEVTKMLMSLGQSSNLPRGPKCSLLVLECRWVPLSICPLVAVAGFDDLAKVDRRGMSKHKSKEEHRTRGR